MDKLQKKSQNLKSSLLMLIVGICFTVNSALASDNVLQAIQVDGVNDSYNIILKSDDVAELKKTIQSPNKMIINLKGIRASKTINTIYNNTSSVDSVVVEPMGEDSVRILVQADNVNNAEIKFDTLKTPLGVLDKTEKQNKSTGEVVLSDPVDSYKPVYDQNANDEEDTGFSLAGAMSGPVGQSIKKVLKNEKVSWMAAFGLFAMIIIGGIKTIKGNDNEIKVGLSQSLKDREVNLYRELGTELPEAPISNRQAMAQRSSTGATGQAGVTGVNYGLRAYQNGTRSPYVSSEIQRPRVTTPTTPSVNTQRTVGGLNSRPMTQNTTQGSVNNMQSAYSAQTTQSTIQNTAPRTILKTAAESARPKATNIDSIKFLESMTKIYEKNGRKDLAQGLKANMKKAKVNLA